VETRGGRSEALEVQGERSGDGGTVGDAAAEDRVPVVGEDGEEGAGPGAEVPGADVAEDAVHGERLVAAVGAGVDHVDGAAAEAPGDQGGDALDRGCEQKAAAGDRCRGWAG